MNLELEKFKFSFVSPLFGRLTLTATHLSYLVAVLLISCTFYSLRFALPLNDEAAHILPSYKFLLGQTPFIDEYNILQLTTLLTYPAFKLFYWFNHHQMAGIFIFERWLYTVIAIICSIYLIRLLSFYCPLYLAILVGINLVSFAPFGLHSPFYDSFAMLFLTLGYFSLCRGMYFMTGIWLGLVATIYPPLGLSWAFIGLAYPDLSFKKLKYYLAGLAVGVAWLIAVISSIGFKHFLLFLSLTLHTGSHFSIMFPQGIKNAWYWYYLVLQKIGSFLIILFMLRLFQRRYQQTWIWQLLVISTLLCLVACTILQLKNYFGDGMVYTMGLFFIAPFLYLLSHTNPLAKSLFRLVWIPSCLIWPIISTVSGSKGLSTVIGLFPGALVSILLMIIIINSLNNSIFSKRIHTICIAVCLLFIAYSYQAANLSSFFGEKSPDLNQYCFTHDQLKGLCTSRQSAQLIQQIQGKLQPFSDQNKTLTVFWVIGIGYFLGNFSPLTNNSFLESPDSTIQFFAQRQQYPDIILIINSFPGFPTDLDLSKFSPSVLELLTKKYNLYSQEKDFSIYRLK